MGDGGPFQETGMTHREGVMVPVLAIGFFCLSNLSTGQGQSLSKSSRRTSSGVKPTLRNDIPHGNTVLWRQPADISTRDLLDGEGGKEDRPKGHSLF